MSGLTSAGFVAKRLPEIRGDIEARLIEAFGDPDLRAESIFGQLVGISAEDKALIWALIEEVYASQYPDTATGVSLDHVSSLTGVVRRPAVPTQVNAIAYGVPGVVLFAGREARNARTLDVYRSFADLTLTPTAARFAAIGVQVVEDAAYSVTVDGTAYTFTASGDTAQQILTGLSSALSTAPGIVRILQTGRLELSSATVRSFAVSSNLSFAEVGSVLPMRAVVPGPLLLPTGDLSEILTPVVGWARVDNPEPGITGSARESDQQLRERRERSVRISGAQTLPAIEARLRALPLVQDVAISSNNGDVTDSFGTLRQHVWAVVEGGEAPDIARVLFEAVAAGIGYRGDVVEQVPSEVTGKEYEVRFDRPTYVDPDIDIEYVKLSNWPDDGEDRIKAALIARTFRIGEKLVTSRLYTPVNTVEGVQVDLLEVDNGSGAVARIEPAPNERIRILAENITLTDVTP
jgi:uncharacterized phage protein gp47/JayE